MFGASTMGHPAHHAYPLPCTHTRYTWAKQSYTRCGIRTRRSSSGNFFARLVVDTTSCCREGCGNCSDIHVHHTEKLFSGNLRSFCVV